MPSRVSGRVSPSYPNPTCFLLQFYLAIANLYASSDRAKSEYVVVYKWHMRRKIFRSHQELPASAPRDVEHFEINGDHYLAVANHASRVPRK